MRPSASFQGAVHRAAVDVRDQRAFIGEAAQQAGDVGQQDQLLRFERPGDHRRGPVGVHIERVACLGDGQGLDDRGQTRPRAAFGAARR